MSVFDTAVKKISDLVGITSKGQATMANSLPVAIASNQSAVSVADGGGSLTVDGPLTDTELRATPVEVLNPVGSPMDITISDGNDVTLGALNDAAVHDGDGTVNAHLRGIAQVAKDTVEPGIGTFGDAAVVSDADGSMLAYLRGLVKIVTEEALETKPRFTWGIVKGGNMALGDLYAGETEDWSAARNANDVISTNHLNVNATIEPYFRGDDAAFDTTPVWVRVPMLGEYSGVNQPWRDFALHIVNELGVAVDVVVYATSDNSTLSLDTVLYRIVDEMDYHQIASATLADGDTMDCGSGGATLTNNSNWPIGYLVVKMTPQADPAAGWWSMTVRRKSA